MGQDCYIMKHGSCGTDTVCRCNMVVAEYAVKNFAWI
jgi:hypothetical protein